MGLLVLAVALFADGCLRDRVGREAPEIVYRRYCASCHGVEGRGDGPAAAALSPPPTDLTRLTYNVDELRWRIDGTQTIRAHGDSRMPVWGEVFAEGLVGEDAPDRRARLHVKAAAIYARSLQRPAR
jgi:mono/diheme cytochrome c family protein